MSIEFVAVSMAGDVYITCDEHGTLRRHMRYIPGDPIEISKKEARWAIETYGYDRVGRSFKHWKDVDEYAESRVPRIEVASDGFPVSVRLARALLPQLKEASQVPSKAVLVPQVIARLLEHRPIREDAELFEELRTLLGESRYTRTPTTHFSPPASGSRMRAVQQFYDLAPAA